MDLLLPRKSVDVRLIAIGVDVVGIEVVEDFMVDVEVVVEVGEGLRRKINKKL